MLCIKSGVPHLDTVDVRLEDSLLWGWVSSPLASTHWVPIAPVPLLPAVASLCPPHHSVSLCGEPSQ